MSKERRTKIIGTGSYLPPYVVDNEYLLNFIIISHQLRTPVSIFWGLLDWWKTGEIKDYPKEKQEKMRKDKKKRCIYFRLRAGKIPKILKDPLGILQNFLNHVMSKFVTRFINYYFSYYFISQ